MEPVSTLESKLCRALVRDGRATWAELGILIGQSPPAAAEKVRRLEERGIIQGFSARLDPEQIGYPLTAFVAVILDRPARRAGFLAAIQKLEQVLEMHHIAGAEDYLLKVVARSTRDLDTFLGDILKTIPGVSRTRTTIVLGTAKSVPITAPLPQTSLKR